MPGVEEAIWITLAGILAVFQGRHKEYDMVLLPDNRGLLLQTVPANLRKEKVYQK